MFDWLFPNPAKDTGKYLNQIPGMMKPYYDPYINAGKGALGEVNTEYGNLLKDPNALIARLGAGYKESPGFQWRLNQGENAINNAQAAGGMAGTGQHQQMAGELAGNLANQDFQQYLQQALGLYGTGLGGKQGLAEMGLGAGSSLANSLANALMQQAQLQYSGQASQNSLFGDLLGNVFSMFGGKK